MKKRILSLALALVMMLITIVIPSSVTVSARGNGYDSFSFKYNNKNYYASLTTQYNKDLGGRTSIYTLAAVEVELGAPRVRYDTINYGYVDEIGRMRFAHFSDDFNMVSTSYVPCRYGMDNVINYVYISGEGSVIINEIRYSGSVMGTPT